MKKSGDVYYSWAMLYIACAALAFIPEPPAWLKVIMVVLSLAFFVPPALLLYRAIPRQQWGTVRLIRNLSILSLSATLVVLVLNVLSVGSAEIVGDVLNGLLNIVSAPMVCGRVWFVSLFLWACLLMVTLKYRKKK